MLLALRVIPRAAKTCVVGIRGNAVLIRLTATPVDGAANEALIQLLAKICGVPARAIVIVAGEHGRQKTVRISGLAMDALIDRLRLGPAA